MGSQIGLPPVGHHLQSGDGIYAEVSDLQLKLGAGTCLHHLHLSGLATEVLVAVAQSDPSHLRDVQAGAIHAHILGW